MAAIKRAWRVIVKHGGQQVVLDIRINHTPHSNAKEILINNLKGIAGRDDYIRLQTNEAISTLALNQQINSQVKQVIYWVDAYEVTLNDLDLTKLGAKSQGS